VAISAAIRRISTQRSAARLAELIDLYERGRLRIFIHKTFPLDEVACAHREVETGHVRGKVVLTID